MKITQVKLGRISTPLRVPFKTALRTVSSVEDVIVELHTDTGAVGYGEAPPTGVITGDTTGAIIGAISSRRKDTADIAAKACDILTDSVIKPLREQVESQEEQIQHLEDQQRKYFALAAYTRQLFHWLQQFCEIVEPDFLKRHPKPHLPDELRADVAPETVEDA